MKTITTLVSSLLAISTVLLAILPAAAASKPNIIIILADDMGYGDCGVYNPESKIATPHIDQLASEGLRFTDAHSAGNTCTPSRYGLLTGTNPARTGVLNTLLKRGDPIIAESEKTIADLLRDQGYSTKMIGKWHLGFEMDMSAKRPTYDFSKQLMGGPMDRGFDYFYGIHSSAGASPLCYFKDRDVVEKPTEKTTFNLHRGAGISKTINAQIAPGFVQQEVSPNFCRNALEIIRAQAASKQDKPLFLYYASPLPHQPWVPIEKFKGKSGVGLYGDYIMQLDDVVGQINRALKETGLDQSTILIFASDNGPGPWAVKDMIEHKHNSSSVLKGCKATIWEGGHRIPFIVKWPGSIPAPSVSDATINFTDVFATLAELMGVDMTKLYLGNAKDSHSFLSVLLDPSKKHERALMVNGLHTIRDGDWKLLSTARHTEPSSINESQFELFNLADDIAEENDVSEAYPERTKRMYKAYQTFAESRTLK